MRVPRDVEWRLFLPIHRDSYTFERLYRKRTAVERVNPPKADLDNVYGFERHFIAGKEKMTVRVGMALVVMPAAPSEHAHCCQPPEAIRLRQTAK